MNHWLRSVSGSSGDAFRRFIIRARRLWMPFKRRYVGLKRLAIWSIAATAVGAVLFVAQAYAPALQLLGGWCWVTNEYCFEAKVYESATEFEAALALEKSGKTRDALAAFEALATERGHPLAAAWSAYAHASGVGTKVDDTRARHFVALADASGLQHLAVLRPEMTAYYMARLAMAGLYGTGWPDARRLASVATANNDLRGYIVLAADPELEKVPARRLELYALPADAGYARALQSSALIVLDDPEATPPEAARALEWLSRAAAQGDDASMYTLGYQSYLGEHVPQSDADALVWWVRAADAGNARGQFGLGWLYLNGRAVETDWAEALRLYTAAAEQGYVGAIGGLGDLYRLGRGVERDHSTAIQFYRRAKDAGSTNAIFRLAYYCWHGGEAAATLDCDDRSTFEAFKEAALKGYASAPYWVALAYLEGRGTSQNAELAMASIEEAIANGSADTKWRAGLLLEDDSRLVTDPERAFDLVQVAASAGESAAMAHLGRMLRDGSEERPEDPEAAIEWLQRSSEMGESYADFLLAETYFYNQHGVVDVASAVEYARKGFERGHKCAAYVLSEIFLWQPEGNYGVTASEALEALRFAADEGHTCALNTLGNLYELGVLVEQSNEAALDYYLRAHDAGSEKGGLNAYRLGSTMPHFKAERREELKLVLTELADRGSQIATCILLEALLNGTFGSAKAEAMSVLYDYREQIGLSVDQRNAIVDSRQFDATQIVGEQRIRTDVAIAANSSD